MVSTSRRALGSHLVAVPGDISEMHSLVLPCPDGALLSSEGHGGPLSKLGCSGYHVEIMTDLRALFHKQRNF